MTISLDSDAKFVTRRVGSSWLAILRYSFSLGFEKLTNLTKASKKGPKKDLLTFFSIWWTIYERHTV